MRPRRAVVALAGAAAAAVAVVRRRRRDDEIELHYEDGSMVTFERGAPVADRLLALARAAVAPSRPS